MFLTTTSHSLNESSDVWRLDKTWRFLLKIKCDKVLQVHHYVISWQYSVLTSFLKKLLETFEYFGGLIVCKKCPWWWSFVKIIWKVERCETTSGHWSWSVVALLSKKPPNSLQINNHQQSSTAQSKNQKPRCSLSVHFKRLLQAPMDSEQWWFWGWLMLSLRFWCHPGPSLPVQVREDLGQGSIVEEACLQHLRDHSD